MQASLPRSLTRKHILQTFYQEMYYASFVKALALLQFAILVLGHPLRQEQIVRPAQLLRRVSYSVVAVDGGAPATSTSSPTKTVTHTASETKTIDKTKTIFSTPTLPTTITVAGPTTLSTTSNGCDTSTVVTPFLETSTPQSAFQTYTTTSIVHKTLAVPPTQSSGAGARYSASPPWNSTLTSNYGPTGTALPTGLVISGP